MRGGKNVEYLLTIQGRLDNFNDFIKANRTNKYKGAECKAENEQICIWYIKQQLKGIRIINPVIMRYRWYEKNMRRDLDGISSFGRKVIQDSLVKTSVLLNDGWKDIKGFSDDFYIDIKNPRIEVQIIEVEDNGRLYKA